jgi:hypothetical protein
MCTIQHLRTCFLLALFATVMFKLYKSREYFTTTVPLAPGNYSVQSSGLILEKNYQPKNKQVDIVETIKNSNKFKINAAGSYKQETNNVRHVNSPDNNKCLPQTMCMQFYKDDESQEKKNNKHNTINSSWRQQNRINFFQGN